MKQSYFRVWFSNGNYLPEFIDIAALGQPEALILAQAERIKGGKCRAVVNIERIEI